MKLVKINKWSMRICLSLFLISSFTYTQPLEKQNTKEKKNTSKIVSIFKCTVGFACLGASAFSLLHAYRTYDTFQELGSASPMLTRAHNLVNRVNRSPVMRRFAQKVNLDTTPSLSPETIKNNMLIKTAGFALLGVALGTTGVTLLSQGLNVSQK